jgi:hypothetical protein
MTHVYFQLPSLTNCPTSHTCQLNGERRLVVLVQEPLVLVNLLFLEHKVDDGLFDCKQIVLLDLLANLGNPPRVLLQLLRHHGHDPLEPPLVDGGDVAGVDAVVDVIVVPVF